MSNLRRSVVWFHSLALLILSSPAIADVPYPGVSPGPASIRTNANQVALGNAVIELTWPIGPQWLNGATIKEVQSGDELKPSDALFEIRLANGQRHGPSNLIPEEPVRVRNVAPTTSSARLAERVAAQAVEAAMRSADGRLRVVWRALLLDEARYLRQEIEVTAVDGDSAIESVSWLQQAVPGARTVGQVDGSVVVARHFFFGCEDPHAQNQAGPSRILIGRWAPADVDLTRRRKVWDLDSSMLQAGTNRVVFRYEHGPHRLDMWGTALLEDGREVANDGHHGRAGGEHVNNGYTLVLPTVKPGAHYQLSAELGTDPELKLAAGETVDSTGRVELTVGTDERVICQLQRNAVLKQGRTLQTSFVVGVAPPGQLRRAFLGYLERERAHPYRPYLHYNSWYDTAWAPFALNETNCLDAIRLCGERLIKPHGVVMDGLVFDDGWDNPRTLWQFHGGFPNGFAPLAALCKEYHTRLGVWLSPFGGYGESKARRLEFGGAQGYETNTTGFSLAGEKYYAAFKQACVGMIRQFGVNHFKFDGIATGMYANGGGQYLLDTEAMRRLMLELREEDPSLYINLTTGSWPSPFWLRYADSLWRQGGDMGHAGKGPLQQQWLTYRDQETFRNIVGKGPLFPLNSLMTQGVAYSRHGMAGEPTFNSAGFRDDVRAFFGSGTSLQELYIQPDKLTAEDWRVLAEAAKWSRANADVLVDTHWIGGDPGKLEVYGYAAWAARKGTLMLRNPDDRPHEITLDVGRVFELPPGTGDSYELKSPWSDHAAQGAVHAEAGRLVPFTLKPFEVLILDATPAPQLSPPEPAGRLAALIPQPVKCSAQPGTFLVKPDAAVVVEARNTASRDSLVESLRRATGLPLLPAAESGTPGSLHVELDEQLTNRVANEGFLMQVTPDRVRIQAATETGVFYAGITLRQMLPPDALRAGAAGASPKSWAIPCAELEDYPRFSWRGLLVDPARHFLPVDFLERLVDLMALHKLNTLQIHLTDDQGWRLKIKKYPKLTQLGSLRKESPSHGRAWEGDGVPYGPFYYTQDEMRDLVAYAQARHVTIMPEIEMPGHFLAALTAYPELSCTGGPFEVRTRWGVHSDILCPGNDQAVAFAQDVLAEVISVFPSRFIHIGGDEAPRERWKGCARCQAQMQLQGLAKEAQLQTWFNSRMETFLTNQGRRMVGWDEILEGGLTPGAVVMSWRGMDGGTTAAAAGHDVIMAPTTHCYFDYAQAQDPDEPESIGGFVPLEKAYAFEPVPPTLPLDRQHHILGAQGELWGEFMWDGRDVEYFAFPRAAALAEVLWSPGQSRNYAGFRQRLREHLRRLEALGVNYRREPGTVRPVRL